MTTRSTGPAGPSAEQLLIEAVLDGDSRSWQSRVAAVPGDRFVETLSVAASAAVFRKWPDDPSLPEMVDYATEIERRYPTQLPVARAVIESVIRAAFGETDLLHGTDAKSIVVAQGMVIRSIGFDVLVTPAQRNSYFSEVIDALGKEQ